MSPRLDEVQWIGTHNSYHAAPPVGLYSLVDDRAKAWDYTHPPLTEQLDAGLRAFELDVYVDDDARFATPLGPIPEATRPAFAAPGLKVFHVPDLDQGSTCPTLRGCLGDIAAWSAAHPHHFPIFIMLECVAKGVGKQGVIKFQDAAPWTAAAVAELETTILDTFGADQLLTPDAVRGSSASLRAAIAERGWPRIDDIRGKVIVLAAHHGGVSAMQLERRQGLRGSPFFVHVEPSNDACSVLILNDPSDDAARIRAARAAHLLVRTRADANLEEIQRRDTSRMTAAVASDANIISTDAPAALQREPRPYRVALPALPPTATVRVHPASDHPNRAAAVTP